MSSNQHPMLNVAIKAARAAGALINRAAFDVDAVRIAQKQVNDFVTEVDQAAEQLIIQTLLDAYPGHGILAEETGTTHGAKDSQYVWIIDPLDGTTNFIHGFPVYAVSIALAVKGQVEHAVVYDPTRNDLFTATRGRGAYLNDRRIRVSRRTQLKDALISTGFPFRPGDNFDAYMRMFAEITQKTAGVRRPGAASLDLAYVAAGYADGFFESGLSIWDVAAGSLLVTEAGGLIGNFTGEANFLDQRECLAASPRIYGQLVSLLGKYSKFAHTPGHTPSTASTPHHNTPHAETAGMDAGTASLPHHQDHTPGHALAAALTPSQPPLHANTDDSLPSDTPPGIDAHTAAETASATDATPAPGPLKAKTHRPQAAGDIPVSFKPRSEDPPREERRRPTTSARTGYPPGRAPGRNNAPSKGEGNWNTPRRQNGDNWKTGRDDRGPSSSGPRSGRNTHGGAGGFGSGFSGGFSGGSGDGSNYSRRADNGGFGKKGFAGNNAPATRKPGNAGAASRKNATPRSDAPRPYRPKGG